MQNEAKKPGEQKTETNLPIHPSAALTQKQSKFVESVRTDKNEKLAQTILRSYSRLQRTKLIKDWRELLDIVGQEHKNVTLQDMYNVTEVLIRLQF